jgi:hypothetical protein
MNIQLKLIIKSVTQWAKLFGSVGQISHSPAGGAVVGIFQEVPSVLAAALSEQRLPVKGLLTVLSRKPSSKRWAAA